VAMSAASGAALPAAPGTFATANYAVAPMPYDADYEAPPRHLRDYVRVVYKYRWLAAGVLRVDFRRDGAGDGAVAAPLHRRDPAAGGASVTHPAPPRRQRASISSRASVAVNGSSSFLATQVAMLKSRDLAERVIRTRRLAENGGLSASRPGARWPARRRRAAAHDAASARRRQHAARARRRWRQRRRRDVRATRPLHALAHRPRPARHRSRRGSLHDPEPDPLRHSRRRPHPSLHRVQRGSAARHRRDRAPLPRSTAPPVGDPARARPRRRSAPSRPSTQRRRQPGAEGRRAEDR